MKRTRIVVILICLFLVFPFLFILLGDLRTMQVQSKPEQQVFLKGKVPKELPSGFYKGSVGGIKTPWQGKKFDAQKDSGINVFLENNTKKDLFPFVTYVGKGIQDRTVDVIKIDYSNSNPWWVRFVLDEIVEVSPGKYLGKVHMTIIPGFPFTLGFFELKK